MPPLPPAQVQEMLKHLQGGWQTDDIWIQRNFKFQDFKAALAFVNRCGEIAEEQGHHPDLLIHGWNQVMVKLYTHSIGGLSRNDFIVAAHIDKLME